MSTDINERASRSTANRLTYQGHEIDRNGLAFALFDLCAPLVHQIIILQFAGYIFQKPKAL